MKRCFHILSALAFAGTAGVSADFSALGPAVESLTRREMRDWDIGGIAVALIDDQRVVYAAGFGEANRDSIFRVGSISKLFNAVAVMQQVEAGKLNLDSPLPADLSPINPFPGAPAVTLRQMLSHRSGFPREAAVGGYMDVSEPGLWATVSTVPACVLVTKPGEKTRYSNFAPSVAGFLVERASNLAFDEYQQKHLLEPLGMSSSFWLRAQFPQGRLVTSHMRVADPRRGLKRQTTPVFDLGTIPAGNFVLNRRNLARFASALLEGGGKLLTAESLAEMWRPQLTSASTGFGLGFMVGQFRQHRLISHSGAVYGHSTSFVILPEARVGAVVLANEDIVNGRTHRISHAALSLLLEAKLGEKPPPSPAPFRAPNLAPFTGDYESQSHWARLEVREGQLMGDLSGQPTRFTPIGELEFTADSRLEDASPVTFGGNADGVITEFKIGGQRYERVPANPPPLPKEWRAVLGTYGPKIIPVIIAERHGHLYAMTENMVDYRLTPVNRHACLLPPGMYVDEQVVFLSGKNGRVHAIDFANMVFRRR